MKLVSKEKNDAVLVRNYTERKVYDKESAARWVCNIRNLDGFEPTLIFLCDSSALVMGKSNDVHLAPNLSVEELIQELNTRQADSLLLNGNYNGQLVIVSINLDLFGIAITMFSKDTACLQKLEKAIGRMDIPN